ncbi:MAG: SDR family oxidoreductase [Hyphomicrobiaceae bacterium]
MLMSVAEIKGRAGVCPEIAGSRVLITGLGATFGVDITRAFAEHGCRMVLQIPDPCPETDALLEIVAESALDLRAHHSAIAKPESATRFAQLANKAFGGLETVINLIQVTRFDLNSATTLEDIETMFQHRLQTAAHTTQVAANRMGLTWSNGSILNILRLPTPKTSAESALAGILRTGFAAMVRLEAAKWGEQGIRVNGIAPRTNICDANPVLTDCMSNEPDIAAVAIYLASKDGRAITGHVLDCDN